MVDMPSNQTKPYQMRSFRGALTNGKLTGVSVLNAKRTIMKKN